MGGAAPVESGKKGKKDLDMVLNLVPFIDLLSCLIAFLLITAVWTQITALQVASTGGLTEKTPPPTKNTIDLRVTIMSSGYILSVAGNLVNIAKVAEPDGSMGYDSKTLVSKLTVVKQAYPEQKSITVAAEDEVLYSDLVGTVDTIIDQAKLPDVSVTPAVN